MAEKVKQTSGKQAGFTLVELSIVILLLGTVIAIVSTAYQSYQVKQQLDRTQDRVTAAAEKIYEFRKIHGHYPCPASLNATRDTADYGVAVANCAAGAPGACSGGTCTQSSTRTDIVAGNVEIGALPFRELNLPEEASYDAYGSRIVYSVTQSMTDKNTIKESGGGIAIVDDNGQDISSPPGSGAFMIVSPGRDRLGAFGLGGANTQPCAGGSGDVENCDYISGAATAVFRAASHSDSTTVAANHFDDVTAFNVPEERAFWRKGLVEKGEKNDDIIDMAENMVVMSAQKAITNASAQLSVLFDDSNQNYDGSLYVRPDPAMPSGMTGKMKAAEICDNASSNCFKISGLVKNCGPGKYVIGIWNGQVQCGKLYMGCKDAGGNPDTSKYVKGFTASGAPVCDTVPPEPIDGYCGTAGGKNDLAATPTTTAELCMSGTPTTLTGNGSSATPYQWSCLGAHGGLTANCKAKLLPPPYDGKCGADNSATLNSAPTNLCSAGQLANFGGSGPWSWSCLGDGTPHQDVTCGASKTMPPVVSCTACSATYHCYTSTYSEGPQQGGPGPSYCVDANNDKSGVEIDYDCAGQSAYIIHATFTGDYVTPIYAKVCGTLCATPVDGVCDNSAVNQCASGTGSAINPSSDISNDYWQCSGVNGGSPSAQCQKAKTCQQVPDGNSPGSHLTCPAGSSLTSGGTGVVACTFPGAGYDPNGAGNRFQVTFAGSNCPAGYGNGTDVSSGSYNRVDCERICP